MTRANLPWSIGLYLAWIVFLSGSVLLTVGGLVPFRLGVVRPSNLFTFLVYAELFFVLVVWPIFIPRILASNGETPAGRSRSILFQVVLLLLLVLPFSLLFLEVGTLDTWSFFQGQLLVAVLASFVGALFSLRTGGRFTAAYYLGFFVLSAGLPFFYYLVYDSFSVSLSFLGYFSPFWAASRLETGSSALVQSAVFGSAAVSLLLGPTFLERTRRTAA